jgi:hypothetical protein
MHSSLPGWLDHKWEGTNVQEVFITPPGAYNNGDLNMDENVIFTRNEM